MVRRLVLVLVVVSLVAGSVGGATAQEKSPSSGDAGGALDQVIADDLIVEGSVCASDINACDNGESFGGPGGQIAVLKLKDSIPLLWFADTTNLDWSMGNFSSSDNFGLFGDTGTAKIRVEQGSPDGILQLTTNGVSLENAAAGGASFVLLRLRSNVAPQQLFKNTSTGAAWSVAMAANDHFVISRRGTPGVEARFYPNGDLRMRGAVRATNFIQTSDVNLKTAFTPVDSAAVLEAVAALPIAEWSFRSDAEGVRHLGPTAQDFAAAFGLGDTRTGIASVDADGVALAAIQALEAENDQLRAEIAELREMVEAFAAD